MSDGSQTGILQTLHGDQLQFRGRCLYSARPLDDADRRVASLVVPSDTIVLWFSPLLWHGLELIVSRLGAGSIIVAYEAEDELAELSAKLLETQPDRNRVRFVGPGASALDSLFEEMGRTRFRRVVEVTIGAGALLHRPTYRSLRDRLDHHIQTVWQNRLTRSAMARLWVRNAIQNLPRLLDSRPLPPYRGVTVVCGAGPSLDSVAGVLRTYRARMRLFCVDTALRPLLLRGITPDVVVALESQVVNVLDFLGPNPRDYLLVADLTSHPAALSIHEKVTLTLTAFEPVRLIERIGRLPGIHRTMPPLGSVGVSAASIALESAEGPVLLAGLDFAVLPGVTHAAGSPAQTRAMLMATRVRPARDAAFGLPLLARTGVAGTAIGTTLILSEYARQLASITRGREAYAIAPFGLDAGVRPLSVSDAARMLDTTVPNRLASTGAASDDRRDWLRGFVDREIDHLVELQKAVDPEQRAQSARTCDYLTADFVDRESADPEDPGFWNRIRVGASYYLAQWRQTAERLRS